MGKPRISSSSGTSGNNDDNYTIRAGDLIQANATIIVGVLLMLALTTSFESSFGRPLNFFDVIIVAGGVIPFVMSYMILLIDFKVKVQGFRWARRLTHGGLLYLVFAIVFILVGGQDTPPTATDPTTGA
jgi:hypothetical protein